VRLIDEKTVSDMNVGIILTVHAGVMRVIERGIEDKKYQLSRVADHLGPVIICNVK